MKILLTVTHRDGKHVHSVVCPNERERTKIHTELAQRYPMANYFIFGENVREDLA
jgi:hypothetical protein